MVQDTEDGYADKSEEGGAKRIQPADRDHITLEVTVDVSGMDERSKEVLTRLAALYEDGFKEVVDKSRDYGWSFMNTGEKLAHTESTPIDSVVRTQVFGLLTRTGDKRERLLENVYGNGESSVSDPAHKTAAEAANYYMMMSFILNNPQLTQSPLQDRS